VDSDASSIRRARKKSKAELSTKDVSDEESADNSEFSDEQSGITVGTLNNLDLELTDSKFPSRDDPISSSFNDDTFQFEEGDASTSARRKRDRKGSAKTANTVDNKALGIMDSMIEAQQAQIANLKTEVAPQHC
jgi:hypothetical protein